MSGRGLTPRTRMSCRGIDAQSAYERPRIDTQNAVVV